MKIETLNATQSFSPPKLEPLEGVGALTITLNMAYFYCGEGNYTRYATRTALYYADGWETECFYQLAALLQADHHADPAILIDSLRMVADDLEKQSPK